MKLRFDPTIGFLLLALLALIIGVIAGSLSSLSYLQPDFWKSFLPFNQLREIHVSSVVSWIVLTSIGGVYFYVSKTLKIALHRPVLRTVHLGIYALTAVCILYSLFSGKMGGREYFTFLPWLLIPILFGWLLLGYNYFISTIGKVKEWPVYMWMWGTGIVFTIFHLCEANFWLFDHFRLHFIRDLTVQWKSYGSLAGSWNMLVYGTAIFLMSRLKDNNIARSKTAFFFYFLGLTNLMLGWSHHIYPVPSEKWIRGLGYAISMTEWIVLAYMITSWLKSVSKTEKKGIQFPYLFLVVTDIWIFANVLIALLISIPAINHFTHGTHITVAHSMGTTIGINTSILIASLFFIVGQLETNYLIKKVRILKVGTYLFNISLIGFLTSLMLAGYIKGQMQYQKGAFHGQIMEAIEPYMQVFLWFGWLLALSLILIALPLFPPLFRAFKKES